MMTRSLAKQLNNNDKGSLQRNSSDKDYLFEMHCKEHLRLMNLAYTIAIILDLSQFLKHRLAQMSYSPTVQNTLKYYM